MRVKLAVFSVMVFALLFAAALTNGSVRRAAEATGPNLDPNPPKLLGTVDPRNLHGSPKAQISKRFFHPGGDAALSAAKARVASLVPGAGLAGRGRIQNQLSNPSPGAGFDGVSYSETSCGCLPPDGALAAGPNHLIGAVNTAFKVWDKSGQLIMGPTDFGLFFLGCNMGGLSDPFVDYDASVDRFVIGILSYDFLYDSAVCVAVSRTSDPTGSWFVYSVPVTSATGGGDLFDFPHLAIGSDAFYVAGNQFTNTARTFSGARVYAWNKAQMYAGQAQADGVHFDIADLTKDTLTPARGVGAAKTMYFLSVDNDNCPCSNANLWKWLDPFGSNTLIFQGTAALISYDEPPAAAQLGGSPIETNDARNLGAHWTNASGSATLFGAHTIACNPGTGTVTCVHWYQIGNLDGVPLLVTQGSIGGAGQFRFYPNLAVNRAGDVTIGFAYSSADDYAGVHTFDIGSGTEAAPRTGQTTADGSRYGDYAGTTVDPDGCTVWHLEEYAKAGTTWGTWVSSMKYSDCSGAPAATPTPTSTLIVPTPTATPLPKSTPTKCNPGQHKHGLC